MECHSKVHRIVSRWFAPQSLHDRFNNGPSNKNQPNKGNQRVKSRKNQSFCNTPVFTLSIIAALILPLLPTADNSTAVAQGQMPDVSGPTTMQQTLTQQTVTQPSMMQIEEEIATISSSADARVQPDSDSKILQVLDRGETFTVTGRSYDDDNGIEWVSVQTAADETVWVLAASIESTTRSVDAFAPTLAPTADIINIDEEIVYIDNIGRIKIFDVEQAGEQRVTWESPETGFIDIAIGDFNNDGDDEIVGIKGINAAGELVVYDPVLNSTTIPAANPGTGEIPWAELYRQSIGFTPTIIAAGEFDQGIPGDEILFGYSTGSTTSEIVVLKGNSLTPNGTGWLKHIPGNTRRGVIFPHIWETVSVANLNNSGTDEVVFTDSRFAPKSFLQIYRLDNGGLDAGTSAVDNNSSKLSWRGTAIGNVYGDSTPELISYRKATGNSVGSATAFISRFTGRALEEEDGDAVIYNPQPYFAFTADINGVVDGSRDDEVIFLRNVTNNDAGIRMIVTDRGSNDTIDESKTEQPLDPDNRWKVGVGADVNGNTVDEIVLMQPNAIRIYRFEASGNNHLKLYRNDEIIPTNSATIRAANVDAIGFLSGASLDYEINGPSKEVPAGENTTTFSLKLTTTSAQDIQYQIQPILPPSWLTGFAPRSGLIGASTGIELDIRVDARNLSPGTYSFDAQLETFGGDIINSPLIVPIEIEVIPALLQASPGSLDFIYHNCELPLDIEPTTLSLLVDGTLGVTFNTAISDISSIVAAQQSLSGAVSSAQLDDGGRLKLRDGWGNAASVQTLPTGGLLTGGLPARELSASSLLGTAPMDADWLVVTPNSGSVESEVDITILPSNLPTTTTTAEALLVIVGDASTGNLPNNVRFVPIRFLCANVDLYLPSMISE